MKAFSKLLVCGFALAVFVAGSGVVLAAQGQPMARGFATFKGLVVKTAFQETLTPALTHNSVANARGFNGSLGFRLTPKISLVGSTSTSIQGLGHDESLTQLSMVNVVYDFNADGKRFRPFLNLGAGIATHDLYRGGVTRFGTAHDSIADLAWGGGAGMDYVINDHMSLTGAYRYTASSSSELLDKYDLGLNDHSVRMGVKYKIPARRIVDPKFGRD